MSQSTNASGNRSARTNARVTMIFIWTFVIIEAIGIGFFLASYSSPS